VEIDPPLGVQIEFTIGKAVACFYAEIGEGLLDCFVGVVLEDGVAAAVISAPSRFQHEG